MELDHEELILKTFSHHPLPFIWKTLKVALISFPFFFVTNFFEGTLSNESILFAYSVIAVIFIGIIGYYWVLFFLNRLVITNERILFIDWKNLFLREEKEIRLEDQFDIETKEKGVLSFLKIFDYGTFEAKTESSITPIIFEYARDPEKIKDFIYHLHIKPSKIENAPLSGTYDSETKKSTEKDSVSSERTG